MSEFTGTDRRHLEVAVDQLERSHAGLEKSYAEQSRIVGQLLAISENNTNAMSRVEAWVTAHEVDYRAVRERLLSQEISGENVVKQMAALSVTIETTMNAYLADRNRAVGGWFTVAAVSGAFVAASALLVGAKSLGVF